MAAFSICFATPTGFVFLVPRNPTKGLKLPPFRKINLCPNSKLRVRGSRVRAANQREESIVLDEKDRQLESELNKSVNGNGNGNYSYGSNGSVDYYSNGSLVKYVDGNGNGNGSVALGEKKEEEVKLLEELIGKKKTVEDIGQEEAWFKKDGQDQVEVVWQMICI